MSDVAAYIDKLLEDQITWYQKKATENKNKFHYFQIIITIANAVIPLVNLVDFAPVQTRVASAILGALITGITGLIEEVSRKLAKLSIKLFIYESSHNHEEMEDVLYT